MQPLEALYSFFLTPQNPRKIGLFRILFGVVLLLTELLWLGHVRDYFTNDGYFSSGLIRSLLPPEHFSLFYFIQQPWLIGLLYWVLLGATVAFIFGIQSRYMSIIIYLLMLSFQERDLQVMYGGDSLLRILCFFVMFLPTDLAFVPSRFAPKDPKPTLGWPVRLIQIQIAMVYFFSAMIKTHSNDWYGGTALFWILNNPNFAPWHHNLWLAKVPALVSLLTYCSLFCELQFPFLVWFKQSRPLSLLLVIGLHLGTILFMNVELFGEIMIATYVIFLDDQELAWLERTATAAWKASYRVLLGLQERLLATS